MGQEAVVKSRGKFIPSLEGVRGFAFLAVFFEHYLKVTVFDPYSDRSWVRPFAAAFAPAWVSVPIFFVLSGYLICGILIDTREKEGYFRIFYSRRILRVFPLYYLTLAAVGVFAAFHSCRLSWHYWVQFLYIQNLFWSYGYIRTLWPNIMTIHLWSMGVEEQFYMLWPLVVWICPNRRVLLRVTLALIAVSFALRFAGPLLSTDHWFFSYWTPTRVDGILMGAALAALRGEKITAWFGRIAKYVALAGTGLLFLYAAAKQNNGMYGGYWSCIIMIPLWNLIAAAVVVAVMQEGSILCRLCSGKGIRWLGARSYALYLFHLTYALWFVGSLLPLLEKYVSAPWAIAATIAAAFAFTAALAALSYRWIEEPAMNLKKRLKYGPEKKTTAVLLEPEPAFPSGN